MKRFAHSLTPVLTISGPGDSLANSDQAVEDGELAMVLPNYDCPDPYPPMKCPLKPEAVSLLL